MPDNVVDEFKCRVCGKECECCPIDGQAICEDCCEGHDYQYEKWRRAKFCVHCDKQQEYDGEPI